MAIRHNKFYKVDTIVDGYELSTEQIQDLADQMDKDMTNWRSATVSF